MALFELCWVGCKTNFADHEHEHAYDDGGGDCAADDVVVDFA